MNVLFVHNNFPAQYRHIAIALARDPKVRVCAIGAAASRGLKSVNTVKYSLDSVDVAATHPFARRFDLESRRAEQVLYALSSLIASGFTPDVIMAHPGWGETLPLRALFPRARFILYCEFFYGVTNRDVGFDAEFAETGVDGHVALHAKNAATLLALADCDAGVAPTPWQRSTFPSEFQRKIHVIHEGVDVDLAKPADDATFALASGRKLRRSDEVVTFVARNLEPLRGYHIFMRALPRIMALRPKAEILVVGAEGVSYGAPAPPGTTWRAKFLAEVDGKIDRKRIHFTGPLPYRDYIAALQVSSAHIYLTYPFVLSWSLIEAMSTGCLVIGSDTEPVRDVIDGRNGILTPFFDNTALADRVVEALAHPGDFRGMRTRARQTALDRFDLQRVCLPQMLSFVRGDEGARRAPKATSSSQSRVRVFVGAGASAPPRS
ncbi:glycosyltransferase [Methylocapsa sp. S129]|uniref:glycosyltransferase n=1 Tax=Methylocapsa sp. S129 TaxID=1641869 RepID=UPI00131C98C2|nr:glycosyltransferase [Methylocapsa sp. S129]